MVSFHTYFMLLAISVRERSTCRKRKVGAILVKDNRVVSTGYNGTPQGMKNCDERGCERCLNTEKYPSGARYDICICVHAEQNAIVTAARFGNSIENAVLYTTLEPCFTCAKEALQAQVQAIYYMDAKEAESDSELQRQYESLQNHFAVPPQNVNPIDIVSSIDAMKKYISDSVIANRHSPAEKPAGTEFPS